MKKCIMIVLMILSGMVLLVAVTNCDNDIRKKTKAYLNKMKCAVVKE